MHFSLSILILVQISPSFPMACFSYNTLYFVSTGVSQALAMHNMELNVHQMRKDDKNCPKSNNESHCRISRSSHNDLSIVVEICLNLPDVRPTIIMLIMSLHRNVDQNVEPTPLLKKDMEVQCVCQLREKSFRSLHLYSFLLSVVLSLRGVISCKSLKLIFVETPHPLTGRTGCAPNNYIVGLRWKSTASKRLYEQKNSWTDRQIIIT